LLSARLKNQKLISSSLRNAEDVVRWLGAVQAQDYIGAKWALALRARDLSDAAIEQAFTEGRILRTHVLRPTWHFVTPADIRWMVALNAPRLQRMNMTYAQRFELTPKLLVKSRDAIERALEGGRTLTREELAAVLRKARIEATGQRLAHLLFHLEQDAVICSGPRRGKHFTYALLHERVPPSRDLTRDEALSELARRYFQSHGPATVRDFAWWSGLPMRDVKAGVALAGVTPLATPPSLQRVADAVYLLPNYDEYVIAYRDRGAIVDPSRARNLGVFTSREFPHQVIVDGRVAGTWRRAISSTRLVIDVKPYSKLTAAQVKALASEAQHYGTFLRLPSELRLQ
jgi:hypothetical protein